jgi:two-component system response regulator VicR
VSAKILIVDDEPPIIDMLRYNLERGNYEVIVAWDGEEAVQKAASELPDLIILDLMLPKLDGLEVFRIVRLERDVPIIMLTARDDEIDRVVGLELGADDYVVKPFSMRELMVRVRNVLRRATPRASESTLLAGNTGPLWLDLSGREATLHGHTLELTTLEFDLLAYLVQHKGQVLSREQLLDGVWGYDYYGDLRVVDAAVKRLRAKLRSVADDGDMILTVRGVGYKLER